ncbi:solute carrier family 49 member A3-like [Ruditapes philippinarum]|uniref:solute carrier family 49 member A3-like n=1 Tax=Ruditapes philippinarum TaxID=129788 RepID=UPI00295B0EFF|nr:solute carrier family 49 member A3-like [Ruditapes philippinarum]
MAAPMDENSKLLSSNSSSDSEFRVYRCRWFILIVVFLLNLTNGMIWITFSPIADTAVPYYSITPFELNILVLVFAIASVPFGFVASWVLDTLGLRLSLILAGWLNGVGSFLRNVSTFDIVPDDTRYTWCLAGQILAACAQPFIMFAPTKLAALWFAGDQRATANMIASMANPLGILVANLLAPNVVQQQKDISLLLWIITGPSLLVMFMATFGICSSVPPTPPTSSAEEKSEPFFEGLKQILKNKRYWFLNFVFGTGLALFTAYSSFLDQMLCPRGYTDTFAGVCGALMIGTGAIGAVFAGIYVDKTKRFEELVKVCWCFSCLFAVAFSQVARLRDQEVLVALSTALFGGFGFAIYPICMELAVEVTYPVAEATSAGLMVISGQVQGIIYILLMQFIAQDLSQEELNKGTGCSLKNAKANDFTPQDWTVPMLFASGVAVFSLLILMLFFKAEYRRMNAEQRLAAEKIMNQTIEFPPPELAT